MSGVGSGSGGDNLENFLAWDEEMLWDFVRTDNMGRSDMSLPAGGSEMTAGKEAEVEVIVPVEKTSGGQGRVSWKSDVKNGKRMMIGDEDDHEVVEVKGGGGGGGGGCGDDHIWTERMRRKKMRNMFNGLHQMLPHLPPKQADKSTIVDEAVTQIKKLELTIEELERQKQERLHLQNLQAPASTRCSRATSPELNNNNNNVALMEDLIGDDPVIFSRNLAPPMVPQAGPRFITWSHDNVVLNICGDEALFNLCSINKPKLLTSICALLESYKIEVIATYVSTNNYNHTTFVLHCRAITASTSNQFNIEAFPAEERYYQAAKDLLLLVAP